MCNISKETTEIIVLLVVGLLCLVALIVPLMLENRNNKTNDNNTES